MTGLAEDLRFALRGLARSPGFAAVAIATLALVIGSNTASFSLIWGAFTRPLAGSQGDWIAGISLEEDVPPALFLAWHQRNKSFSHLAAAANDTVLLTTSAGPQPVAVTRVSLDFFSVLPGPTVLGRTFGPGEVEQAKGAVAVISQELWTRHLARDQQIVGKTIQLGDRRFVVAGVMASDFVYPRGRDVWIPLLESEVISCEPCVPLQVVGLLRPGVKPWKAQPDLEEIVDEFHKRNPGVSYRSSDAFLVHPFRWRILAPAQGDMLPMYVVFGVTFTAWLLLFVGWANLATHLLSRAVYRRSEIAARISVGGSRWRIVRQLLIESVTLSLIGAAAGLLVALGLLWLLPRLVGDAALPAGAGGPHLDVATLLYTTGLALATALGFGLVPAWLLARTDLNQVIREASRGQTGAQDTSHIRDILVGLQILVAAFVATMAFDNTPPHEPQTQIGFATTPIAYATVELQNRYAGNHAQTGFARDVLGALRRLPGARFAAMSTAIEETPTKGMVLEGAKPGVTMDVRPIAVAGDFFAAVELPLLRGTSLDDAGHVGTVAEAVVDADLARRLSPDHDPIGRRFRFDGEDTWFTIVGVAADAGRFTAERTTITVYVPFPHFRTLTTTLLVRGEGNPRSLVAGLRNVVGEISGWQQPVLELGPYQDRLIADKQKVRKVYGAFLLIAAIVLLIVMVGVSGIVALQVASRGRDLGVRMAMGATPLGVIRTVVARICVPVIAGTLLGAALAALLNSATGTRVDFLSLAAPIVVVLLVALGAAVIPALKIALGDPMVALRQD